MVVLSPCARAAFTLDHECFTQSSYVGLRTALLQQLPNVPTSLQVSLNHHSCGGEAVDYPPPFKHYRGHLAIKLFSLDSGIKEIDENENEDECQLLGFNLVLRYSNNMQTQSCFEMVHPRTPQSDYDSTK